MTKDPTIHIVDDDDAVRDSLRWLMESVGYRVKLYGSARAFLEEIPGSGCILLDIRMRDMSGLELQRRLQERGGCPPTIFITGHGDIGMAVQAMKNGAADFLTKPLDEQKLLDAVQRALDRASLERGDGRDRGLTAERLASLSVREREILDRVIEGKLNKVIADELNISSKTVEAHRARVMEKMHARSLADLIRQTLLLGPDRGN